MFCSDNQTVPDKTKRALRHPAGIVHGLLGYGSSISKLLNPVGEADVDLEAGSDTGLGRLTSLCEWKGPAECAFDFSVTERIMPRHFTS